MRGLYCDPFFFQKLLLPDVFSFRHTSAPKLSIGVLSDEYGSMRNDNNPSTCGVPLSYCFCLVRSWYQFHDLRTAKPNALGSAQRRRKPTAASKTPRSTSFLAHARCTQNNVLLSRFCRPEIQSPRVRISLSRPVWIQIMSADSRACQESEARLTLCRFELTSRFE